MRDVFAVLDEVYAGRERLESGEIHGEAVALEAPADVLNALGRLPEGVYNLDEAADAVSQLVAPARLATGGVPGSQLLDDDLLRELAVLHATRHETLRHGSTQALSHHDQRTAELEGEYLRRFPQREVSPERLTAGAQERVTRTSPEQAAAAGRSATVPGGGTAQEATTGQPEAGSRAAAEPQPHAEEPPLVEEPPGGSRAGAEQERAVGEPELGARSGAEQEPAMGEVAGRSRSAAGREPDAGARTAGVRTGAEQEWEPIDLVRAEGRDPTPENLERARRRLAEEGPAAIERTVP